MLDPWNARVPLPDPKVCAESAAGRALPLSGSPGRGRTGPPGQPPEAGQDGPVRDGPSDFAARPGEGELGGCGICAARFDGPHRGQEVIGGGRCVAEPKTQLARLQIRPVRCRRELQRSIDRRRRLVRARRSEEGGGQEGVGRGVARRPIGGEAELLDRELDAFMRERAEALTERFPGARRRAHSSSSRATATGPAIRFVSRPCQVADRLRRLQAAIPSGVMTVVATLMRTTAA